MRRFARRECAADPEASLETALHPPLTLPRQARDQPPVMEQPPARQPGSPTAPALAAAQPAVVQGNSAGLVTVKAEPAAARQPAAALQPEQRGAPHARQQPVEDLYGDLDVRTRGTAPPAQQQLPSQPAARSHQQQQSVQHVSTAQQPPAVGAAGAAAGGAAAPQQADAAASGDLKALLSNPAALQALLKDPAQLQRLLEKHPALITILKNTLGQK